jgi:hypothetical protein
MADMANLIGKAVTWRSGAGKGSVHLKGTVVDQWEDKLTVVVTHVRFPDYGGSFIQRDRRWFDLSPAKEISLDTRDIA